MADVLVKTVIDWARSVRSTKLYLWVTDGNDGAERLYLRNGFVRTGAAKDVRPGHLEYEMSREI